MSKDSKKASSPRILLVDDDPGILLMLTDIFTSVGYVVDAVRTGVEALHKAPEETYNAVILDMGLPDIIGTSVQKALVHRHPNLPIIILTAGGSQKLKQECVDSGAFAYFAKPCNFDELKKAVREAVGSGKKKQE